MKNLIQLKVSILLALTLGATLTMRSQGAHIAEPCTLVYGKVLGVGAAQPFQITQGELVWTIQRSDGRLVTLKTSLFNDTAGGYSYRLRIPHSAVALGLPQDADSVPSSALPLLHRHQTVTIDGQTATLLGPASALFNSQQLLRAMTHRLDLAITRTALDSDGDGLPDWWEDAQGLNKQNPNDATWRGVDGLSAAEAYARGLSIDQDHSIPTLLTEEVTVYPNGQTVLLLDAFDLDSATTNLIYRVTHLPAAGTLLLRNALEDPAAPDVAIGVDGEFTQADLLCGRVLYVGDAAADDPGSIGLLLRDENPEHLAVAAVVRLLAYPLPTIGDPTTLPNLEQCRYANATYAANGYIVADATSLPAETVVSTPSSELVGAELSAHVAAYGAVRPYLLVGSAGSVLRGGAAADVIALYGTVAQVAGGAGADRFVLHELAAGAIAISDFNPAEGDVLDLTHLPLPTGEFANDFLTSTAAADGIALQLNLDGAVAGTRVLTITLPGTYSATALYDIADIGALALGTRGLKPLISVAATTPNAERNEPTPGQYTITRRGSLVGTLTLNANLGGTAINGTDYDYLALPLTLPAGERKLILTLIPTDSDANSDKTAKLTLENGSGYLCDTAPSATITIAPLKMEISLTTLNAVAVKEDQIIGVIELTRRRVLNKPVDVYFTLSGTAVRNSDYTLTSDLELNGIGAGIWRLKLPAGYEWATIDVTTQPGADLESGARTVELTLKTNANYLIRTPGTFAQVALIERYDTYEKWLNRSFAGGNAEQQPLAMPSTSHDELSLFQRYAFGLGAENPRKDGLPRPFFDQDGHLVVAFRRPLAVSDVVYTPQAMTNLQNPSASAIGLEEINAPDGSRDPEIKYYRVKTRPPTAFVNVRATKE